MRVVIIGGGEVGLFIAATLATDRHDVIVVDHNPAQAAALQARLDARVVLGNGASPKMLAEIEAGKADLLLAVTEVDEVNIIAALAAHQLGAKHTVARVRDPEYFGHESFAHDVLGIDFVVHPERATAEEIEAAIMLPGAVNVDTFADGDLAIAEVILPAESPQVGLPLGRHETPLPHVIAGIVRDGQTIIPSPDEAPAVGDHVLVAAERKDIARVVAHLAAGPRRADRAVLFGAGKIGFHLAQRLEADHVRLTVLERDEKRARYVAERLEHSLVVHDEGVGKQTLLAHGVDQADAFVAMTGDDRANLLACLYARELGSGLCLPVVSRDEFVPLVSALGIDAAFSPRRITAEAILRFVRGRHVLSMQLLPGGSELLELEADASSPVVTRRPGRPCLPADCRVASIVREGRVLLPAGDERILPMDRVLVMAMKHAVRDAERAFRSAA